MRATSPICDQESACGLVLRVAVDEKICDQRLTSGIVDLLNDGKKFVSEVNANATTMTISRSCRDYIIEGAPSPSGHASTRRVNLGIDDILQEAFVGAEEGRQRQSQWLTGDKSSTLSGFRGME